MQASWRFGDAASAHAYPLDVSSGLVWRQGAAGVFCEMALPPCPVGHIIVPSLSLPGAQHSYQVTLQAGEASWRLQPVPSHRPLLPSCSAESTSRRRSAAFNPVSTQIDCFHTEANMPASRLLFHLHQPSPPDRYLATLSVRPLRMAPAKPKQQAVHTPAPPGISQMEGPQGVRHRICSPTALAMMLKAEDAKIHWPDVVAQCFDERTQAYGCWPAAIRCAAVHGRVGAVEALASWDPVLAVLRAGLPMVASIAFGPGELPGAPLAKTAGHLVTCHGLDGDAVLVQDPAAENAAAVPRRYDLAAFSKAWLGHRGAAYILGRP